MKARKLEAAVEEGKEEGKVVKEEKERRFEDIVPAGSLDELLNQLIAVQEGIRPEDVTVEYIREQRRRRFYPTTRYDISSDRGGYNTTGLTFFTQEEFDAIEQRVEAELAKF